jgi:hypothetical protein
MSVTNPRIPLSVRGFPGPNRDGLLRTEVHIECRRAIWILYKEPERTFVCSICGNGGGDGKSDGSKVVVKPPHDHSGSLGDHVVPATV